MLVAHANALDGVRALHQSNVSTQLHQNEDLLASQRRACWGHGLQEKQSTQCGKGHETCTKQCIGPDCSSDTTTNPDAVAMNVDSTLTQEELKMARAEAVCKQACNPSQTASPGIQAGMCNCMTQVQHVAACIVLQQVASNSNVISLCNLRSIDRLHRCRLCMSEGMPRLAANTHVSLGNTPWKVVVA